MKLFEEKEKNVILQVLRVLFNAICTRQTALNATQMRAILQGEKEKGGVNHFRVTPPFR
ncbi:hypothetical protein [Dysosmobacter sp.]